MSAALAFAALAASLAAQSVLVVAPTPGAGVDFTVIQDAVDAAADGDVVLVRAGSYAGFTVVAKGLTVVADGGRPSVGSDGNGIAVTDLTAGQEFVLRGLAVGGTAGPALGVVNCAGPVTVEDCGLSTVFPIIADQAVRVSRSATVSIARCQLVGTSTTRRIATGLDMYASTVLLHACVVVGGGGVTGGFSPDGVSAAVVSGSVLSATGTTFVGGGGAAPLPPLCAFGGSGGDALTLVDPNAAAYLRSCILTPGAAGAGGGCLPAGTAGVPVAGAGTAVFLGGPIGDAVASSPVRAGGTMTLTLRAFPGTTTWLLAAPRQAPALFLGCGGGLLPDVGTSAIVFLGAMPATGSLTLSLAVPAALPAEAVPVFFQPVLTDANGCWLVSPSAALVVDASF